MLSERLPVSLTCCLEANDNSEVKLTYNYMIFFLYLS